MPFQNYLISSPSWNVDNFITSFDEILKATLEVISNISLQDNVWTQATLPINFGGLGTRMLKEIALLAFLSSVHGSLNLVSQLLYFSDENSIHDGGYRCWSAVNDSFPVNRIFQKDWDLINVSIYKTSRYSQI